MYIPIYPLTFKTTRQHYKNFFYWNHVDKVTTTIIKNACSRSEENFLKKNFVFSKNLNKESTLFYGIEKNGLPIKHHYGFNAMC